MTRNALPCRTDPATMKRRLDDWRSGGIIYQVFVDRFAPSDRLEEKREHYAAPRRLHAWERTPDRGKRVEEEHNMEGELEFWGGDLASLRARLDYIQELGTDVLYLNPVFHAYTNHKYDAIDYLRVDPQYGTNEELKDLADDLHARGMKLMLDGVFNHVGRRNPMFVEAKENPDSRYRSWFFFGDKIPNGYRGWRNVANLPELAVENPEVRKYLWEGHDSVVRHYLRETGIDGWRLDVAPDLGLEYLAALTAAAHEERPGSAVIGECWNYPEEWFGVVDGILNLHARFLITDFCEGRLTPSRAGRAIERMIEDAGIENILRCHLVLDNHDTPRQTHFIADKRDRNLARVLQFTLPGSPTVYYGSELGMDGGEDPRNRAPMRWDLLTEENETLALHRKLIALRNEAPTLRAGDFRLLDADNCLAFLRLGPDPRETVLVAVNPNDEAVEERVQVRDSLLVDGTAMKCAFSGRKLNTWSGMASIELGPKEACVYQNLDKGDGPAYSPFKRLKG